MRSTGHKMWYKNPIYLFGIACLVYLYFGYIYITFNISKIYKEPKFLLLVAIFYLAFIYEKNRESGSVLPIPTPMKPSPSKVASVFSPNLGYPQKIPKRWPPSTRIGSAGATKTVDLVDKLRRQVGPNSTSPSKRKGGGVLSDKK